MVILENDPQVIADIEKRLFKQGKKPASMTTANGSADKLAALVRNHALVVAPLPTGNSSMAHLLSTSPCPTLFCPKLKPR